MLLKIIVFFVNLITNECKQYNNRVKGIENITPANRIGIYATGKRRTVP